MATSQPSSLASFWGPGASIAFRHPSGLLSKRSSTTTGAQLMRRSARGIKPVVKQETGPTPKSVRLKAPRLARVARWWVAGSGRNLSAGPTQNILRRLGVRAVKPSSRSATTRDIALQFGHQDGGELVRTLYGHPDAKLARERGPCTTPKSRTRSISLRSRRSRRRSAWHR